MKKKMCSSSVVTVSLCLLLCLPPCLSSDVSKALKVKPGEDATLQCHSSEKADVVLIQWTRPDLTLEGYIFIYRDGRVHGESLHPSYRGRVELKDPEMKDGDVSVILRNINFSDTGRYECYVGNHGSKPKLISNITLIVQDSVNIRAEPGQSVSLPCRAPSNTNIVVAEWTRPGLKPGYILVYRDGKPDPHNQHPSYQNRVELKDRDMKDGDVSMILKNVTRDDTGTYECQVVYTKTESNSGSSMRTVPISIVHLQVQSVSQHALGVEVKVYEGAESVLLPCQVTVTDPQFNAVSWSVERLLDKIVHLRDQRGEDQDEDYRGRTSMRTDALRTGNLSLTLRNPTFTDSDTYTCIYREKGLEKRRQEVYLKVKECPPPSSWVIAVAVLVLLVLLVGVGLYVHKQSNRVIDQQVEVEEGEESVLLSFQTIPADPSGDVKVEWRDKDNKKVHVSQNGSVEQDQRYMMKKDLKTGAYSLILKEPRVTDRGEYTCRIYNKDRDFLRRTRVELKVKEKNKPSTTGTEGGGQRGGRTEREDSLTLARPL